MSCHSCMSILFIHDICYLYCVFMKVCFLHIPVYQHLCNVIFTKNSPQSLSLLSRILDISSSMNPGAQINLRIFVVFYIPRTIIPWYYHTVHLKHILQFSFQSFYCQPITPHFLLSAMTLYVPMIHKCVYFRFISTVSLCRGREYYQMGMTT
jgi:hypothetical protein